MKQSTKNTIIKIIQIVLYVIIGVFIIANPGITNKVISYIFGGLLIAIGSLLIIFGLTTAAFMFNLVGSILFGVIAISFGIGVIANDTLLINLFAVYLIVTGISKIVDSVDFNRKAYNLWYLELIFGIIGVTVGCILLFLPKDAVEQAFSWICGLTLIFNGVVNLVELIVIQKGKRTLKKHIESNIKMNKQIRQDYIDAEIINEKDVDEK